MRTLLLALALAVPGEALAQATCPTDTSIATVLAPGFTCTIADKTFSDFTITGAPTSALINFGQLGPLFAVTLTRDGAFFAPGRVIFDYTVTPLAPAVIRIGTVGVDVSFPMVTTTTTMNSALLTGTPITNGGSGIIIFTPGVPSVAVDNTATIGPLAELNSISNDFSQQLISVPEPSSLALLALGLGGIWIRRRHS